MHSVLGIGLSFMLLVYVVCCFGMFVVWFVRLFALLNSVCLTVWYLLVVCLIGCWVN